MSATAAPAPVLLDGMRLLTALGAWLLASAAVACLLAPVGEEMLFRGVLHTWLRQRVPAWVTIALTAVAFAAIHGFPAILPLAFAIGVGFGWVRERTRSIVPTVVAHALHNLIMASASYALTEWTARLPAWGAG